MFQQTIGSSPQSINYSQTSLLRSCCAEDKSTSQNSYAVTSDSTEPFKTDRWAIGIRTWLPSIKFTSHPSQRLGKVDRLICTADPMYGMVTVHHRESYATVLRFCVVYYPPCTCSTSYPTHNITSHSCQRVSQTARHAVTVPGPCPTNNSNDQAADLARFSSATLHCGKESSKTTMKPYTSAAKSFLSPLFSKHKACSSSTIQPSCTSQCPIASCLDYSCSALAVRAEYNTCIIIKTHRSCVFCLQFNLNLPFPTWKPPDSAFCARVPSINWTRRIPAPGEKEKRGVRLARPYVSAD